VRLADNDAEARGFCGGPFGMGRVYVEGLRGSEVRDPPSGEQTRTSTRETLGAIEISWCAG